MAQSARKPNTLAAMDVKPQGDKNRTSYFFNMKNRLGSKLPPGVSQPPQFAKPPWSTEPHAQMMTEGQNGPIVSRAPNHIPHIRNPKLRQYYLQGPALDLNTALVTEEDKAAPSGASVSSRGLHGDTVFSVSSKFIGDNKSTEEKRMVGTILPPHASSQPGMLGGQLVSKRKDSSVSGDSPHGDPDLEFGLISKPEAKVDQGSSDSLTAQLPSPSPEAEYDKLLDVEAVPLPDGRLCLLALPPECCRTEGSEAMLYLKLFCRYVTDCKGVVSGILLVTSSKIFFDPSKTHPLVIENGCEEYLLSCSLDNLASIAFFSDISRVHFTSSEQRRKGKGHTIFQKIKNVKSGTGGPKTHGASSPALVSAAPSVLPSPALNVSEGGEKAGSRDMEEVDGDLTNSSLEGSLAATFCCAGQETENKMEDIKQPSPKSQTAENARPSAGRLGGLMFVRLRVQPSAIKRKGSTKMLPRRDTWLALSQESSDELQAYLQRHRPDLCVLEGEDEADRHDEGFVLIEEEENEMFPKHTGSGDDWEMVLMEGNKDKPVMDVDKNPEGLNNIVETSQILQASHIQELCKELPPRTIGLSWQLAYSTSRCGASLKSLYGKLSVTDSPVLIVIKDSLDEMFGAFLSHPLRRSERFYGTGETFLYMLHPRFKCFRWTGENSFFIKGDLDCFTIGGGSGHCGLWVDDNLYRGLSSPCDTFYNCSLSENEDFHIIELEAWTFS